MDLALEERDRGLIGSFSGDGLGDGDSEESRVGVFGFPGDSSLANGTSVASMVETEGILLNPL